MKKEDFLIKIFKEGKISLVETSEEIKESYIKKSESNLISAKILLENERLEESISLAYYSMYHMISALFFKAGIKCENHSASIILLKQLFSIDNEDISLAKKERIDKQYYTDFHIIKIHRKLLPTSKDVGLTEFSFNSGFLGCQKALHPKSKDSGFTLFQHN